jgi:glycosyltransferase involved in cell wall biosynthesis
VSAVHEVVAPTAERPRSQPLVSVLIPCYERESLLSAAVHSALAQDYAQLDVVVVDDASPCARYADVLAIADSRLRFHRNTANLGRVANYRRAVVELARGDWVVMLDGDDRFDDSRFISRAIEAALSAPDVCVVAARCITSSPAGSTVSSVPGTLMMHGLQVLERLPHDEYLFFHLATLYRRDQAIAIGFYQADVISSDWESLYRLVARGRVAFIDCVAGTWHLHGTNASSSSQWRELAANLRIWPAVYAYAQQFGMAEQAARSACRRCLARFGAIHMASVLNTGRVADTLRLARALWQIDGTACVRALVQLGDRAARAAVRRARLGTSNSAA